MKLGPHLQCNMDSVGSSMVELTCERFLQWIFYIGYHRTAGRLMRIWTVRRDWTRFWVWDFKWISTRYESFAMAHFYDYEYSVMKDSWRMVIV